MASDAVRCNTGVELTATEYLLVDAVPHTPLLGGCTATCRTVTRVPTWRSPSLRAPSTPHAWWLRWDHTERAAVELQYCVSGDPGRGEDDPEGDCLLPKDHRGRHTWQLLRPTFDVTRAAHGVSETAAQRLRASAAPAGPLIRVHRYEYILAIKWPEFERWLMIWPDQYRTSPQTAHRPQPPNGGPWPSATPTSTARTGSTPPPTTTTT